MGLELHVCAGEGRGTQALFLTHQQQEQSTPEMAFEETLSAILPCSRRLRLWVERQQARRTSDLLTHHGLRAASPAQTLSNPNNWNCNPCGHGDTVISIHTMVPSDTYNRLGLEERVSIMPRATQLVHLRLGRKSLESRFRAMGNWHLGTDHMSGPDVSRKNKIFSKGLRTLPPAEAFPACLLPWQPILWEGRGC